jgi:hypothetical protein
MATTPKTWVQKRDADKSSKIEKLDIDFADMRAGQRMLVATPAIVDAYIRQIPKGHHTPLAVMRKDLAAEYHADVTCPVTSGIFLRIVAEAAYEEYEAGKPIGKISPFWRVIDGKSKTAAKLSFGTDFLLAQRKKEGLDKHL